MKQLLILSGKGGTGKTTIASAFIKLAKAKAYADCDVDAPNLHLITGWNTEPQKQTIMGCQLLRSIGNCALPATSAGKTVASRPSWLKRNIKWTPLPVKAVAFARMFARWKRSQWSRLWPAI